ncbi:MAG: hypothetical protein ABR915_14045 [Thermoguttaceae bacterium]|jgi:hypothetical protein
MGKTIPVACAADSETFPKAKRRISARASYKAVFWLAGAALCGCAVSPWSSHNEVQPKPAPAAAASATAKYPAGVNAPAANTGAQAMQQVIAELQQVGAVDPAAQEKLMADLRQTEPSLWPMMVTQYRAAAAYRRQLAQQDASLTSPGRPAAKPEADQADRASSSPAGARLARAAASGPAGPSPEPTTGCGGQSSVGEVRSDPGNRSGPPTETLAAAQASDAGSRTPRQAAPAVLPPQGAMHRLSPPADAAKPPEAQVVPASYESPAPGDSQRQLAAAIRAMETEANGSSGGQGDLVLQSRLRMLYLLAGRREDALQPIPTAPAALQDFWTKQLYGLGVWLDADRTPDAARRAADTKRILSEAVARLGESSPLAVRNLAFCTSVQSFGEIRPFKKAEFTPDQEVLLYAEVDNFAAESTPKGFHTSLRSNYQIFDGRGQRVADHEFAPIEEFCQNFRRDFFISYHLRIPKQIYPGRHALQLTVEDLKSRKVGQSTIDFVVKGDKGQE